MGQDLKVLFLGLFLFLPVQRAVAQQTPPGPPPSMPPEQQASFEETHCIGIESSIFGYHFVLNGKDLDEPTLKQMVAAIDDEQAMKTLLSSEDHSNLGWMLLAGGGGLVLTGGAINWSNGSNTLSQVLVFGGLCVDVAGGFFWRQAESEKLSVVGRYNTLVKEDNGITLMDLDDKNMGLAFAVKF